MNEDKIMKALVEVKAPGAMCSLEKKLRDKYESLLTDEEKAYNGPGYNCIRVVTIITYCGNSYDMELSSPIRKIKEMPGIKKGEHFKTTLSDENLELAEGFEPKDLRIIREIGQISKVVDLTNTRGQDFELFSSIVNRCGYGEYEYQRYVKGSPMEGTLFSADPGTFRRDLSAIQFLISNNDDYPIFDAIKNTLHISQENLEKLWKELSRKFYSSYDSSAEYAKAWEGKKNVVNPYKMARISLIKKDTEEYKILSRKISLGQGPIVMVEKNGRVEEKEWWEQELQKFWSGNTYKEWASRVIEIDKELKEGFKRDVKIDLENDRLEDVLKKKEQMTKAEWERMTAWLGGDPIKVLDKNWDLMRRLFKRQTI